MEPAIAADHRVIEVWRVQDATSLPDGLDVLSPDERQRASRLLRPADCRSFVATRSALRLLLAGRTGLRPVDVAFETNSHGKPRLANRDLDRHVSFNVSHTAGLALIALGTSEIGVDVERLRQRQRHVDDEPPTRYFATDERQQIMRVHGAARAAARVGLWVRKEAYLKAIGCGLSGTLDSFSVTLAAEQLVAGSKIVELEVPSRYTAAVAARGSEWTVRVTDFSWTKLPI
jgi:4'-phosphopantetheinyl transferase